MAVVGAMSIHDHHIELYQLGAAVIGAICAVGLLYMADKARRIYKASGENDPAMLATAAANIRDEGLRLTKHALFVAIGIVSIVMEPSRAELSERGIIIRWILIFISFLMMAQSVMVWRDRVALEKISLRRDRRQGDKVPHQGRRKDDR